MPPVNVVLARRGGELHPVTAGDARMLIEGIEEGKRYRFIALKDRSAPHHRTFFGVIAAAFENWPEGEEPEPEDENHLREWLEIKAGHALYADIDLTLSPIALALTIGAVMAKIGGKRPFWRESADGKRLRVYWADSVRWNKIDEFEFHRVAAPVFEIIEEKTGITVEGWKQAKKEAAA